MLDEYTQIEPSQSTKQTMTERSSMPQRKEDKTLDELYRVFKGLLNTVDKTMLLEQLKQLSSVHSSTQNESDSNLATRKSKLKAERQPFCNYKEEVLPTKPTSQSQLEKRPPA